MHIASTLNVALLLEEKNNFTKRKTRHTDPIEFSAKKQELNWLLEVPNFGNWDSLKVASPFSGLDRNQHSPLRANGPGHQRKAWPVVENIPDTRMKSSTSFNPWIGCVDSISRKSLIHSIVSAAEAPKTKNHRLSALL